MHDCPHCGYFPDPEPEDEELCEFCEAMPDEPHHPECFLATLDFAQLGYCDNCQREFVTTCAFDGHECEG